MCGIRCSIHEAEPTTTTEELEPEWLRRRGPDEQHSVVIQATSSVHQVVLQSSVLCLRSLHVSQPVQIDVDCEPSMKVMAHFCWNGELYQVASAGRPEVVDSVDDVVASDTRWMTQQLECMLRLVMKQTIADRGMGSDTKEFFCSFGNALKVFLGSCILDAEFAFCLAMVATTDNANGSTNEEVGVWYGRDSLGRRSLVVVEEGHAGFRWEVASAASEGDTAAEAPPSTVFHYNPQTRQTSAFAWTPASPEQTWFPMQDEEKSVCYRRQLRRLLSEAIERRLRLTPSSFHPQCAILFSGGVDSVVLACLALHVVSDAACSVQLVNVGFVDEEHRDNHPDEASIDAADTKAAFASIEDLKRLFPNRNVSLVHRAVPYAEIQAIQNTRIPQLMYPKDAATSVMDLNIATALWFAADTAKAHNPKNRILLTGLGADEYMGGYGRHRTAFREGSLDQLRRELQLDQSRLWERNCGRDDRVLSDTGQEVRYPYLDAHVRHFLTEVCPLKDVCDLDLPPGRGDKQLLRLLAKDLGLDAASSTVKRAIQFGSRLSHVVDKQRFGSRRKANKKHNL